LRLCSRQSAYPYFSSKSLTFSSQPYPPPFYSHPPVVVVLKICGNYCGPGYCNTRSITEADCVNKGIWGGSPVVYIVELECFSISWFWSVLYSIRVSGERNVRVTMVSKVLDMTLGVTTRFEPGLFHIMGLGYLYCGSGVLHIVGLAFGVCMGWLNEK
jgi:hypothetical protein